MTHQTVGYVRVSSQGQNTERQLQGIQVDKEFVDIASGNAKDRKNLISCIDYVREGDTLVVDSIDRLARDLFSLQEIVSSLIKKGVKVKFLKEGLIFSGDSDPISMLTLQMMGSFAEFERSMIRARQRDGIEAAKKAGKHLGRPAKLNDKMKNKALSLFENKRSIRSIAKELEISRASVYKLLGKN